MGQPRLYSRREFLRSSAAAAALAGASGTLLTACPKPGPAAGSDIVSAAIHPAIGVARVGNSADVFFFGPEVPGALPRSAKGFKDASGAIARQAARFRVYGLDGSGRVVRELSPSEATITWTVDVANKKAAWYEFNTAMDLDFASPVKRRNASKKGDARNELVVASKGKTISGVGAAPVKLDGGSFLGEPVELGELMIDESGRLVVLPGNGQGYSPTKKRMKSFSDNDEWTDNVGDGSVRASVKIGDRTIDAEPAWLLVTPPNYGPALSTGLITLYDSVASALADAKRYEPPSFSFSRDVYALFARMVDMQWVNAGYLETNGWGSPEDWLDATNADQLADASDDNKEWRTELFDRFRPPDYPKPDVAQLPQMYGDGVDFPVRNNHQFLALTSLQHQRLQKWADGDFTDDRSKKQPDKIEDVPIADQPAVLDRAVLDSCLGGAYHPGIEAPWTLRVPTMWSKAFRLKIESTEPKLRDYGDELEPETAMGEQGPVHGVTPGDLTMWMGVPWHGDAGSCRSGYERDPSPASPTFWPARIPNQVLSEADYDIVVDEDRSMDERLEAFRRRHDWQRHVTSREFEKTLASMVSDWAKLGVVTERPGPKDEKFPATMKVETALGFDSEPDEEIAADGKPY